MIRHPKRDSIEASIRAGVSDRRITADLRVNRRTVALIRAEIGVAPLNRKVDTDQYIAENTTAPDDGGHVFWTGRLTTSRTPVVRHNDHEVQVVRYLFEQLYGRPPVGMVKSECDAAGCITAMHMQDEPGRTATRLLLRQLHGYQAPWSECSTCGSTWRETGRVQADLELYCVRCHSARAIRNRKIRNERKAQS